MSDPGEKQFQVVVDFGRGADRRTRITRIDLLFDRNGRGYAGDEIDLGLVDLAEELPGIGRQAFDITPLPLREDGVEGERRFTRTGKAGNHHQFVMRDLDLDIFEVVYTGSLDVDHLLGRVVDRNTPPL